jgi:hypothetical protein
MSSSLRIIVTGLIAQESANKRLSGKWFYNADGGPSGDHRVAEDCNFHIACAPTSWSASAWEPAVIARSSRSVVQYFCQRKQILKFADHLLNLSGSGMERRTPASPPARIHIDSDPVFTQVSWNWEGELRDAVQLKAVNE